MSGVDPILLRGLSAIEPYLDDVVVAGGWVPHIYELLYDQADAGRSPRTRDIDLAIPRSVPVRGKSIDELLGEADFECRFHSLDTPPVTKYVATDTDDDEGVIEIEFITDAPGSSEAVTMVQSDLTAQELHFVGLLLENPWPVDFTDLTEGKVRYTVRIPTPGAFVLHKALVFKGRRNRLKAEKDLYYVFFVLDALPAWRGMIREQLARLAREQPAWFRRCLKNVRDIFDSPESDGVDALLNQRPATSYRDMNDAQFRQYAFSIMSELIGIMDSSVMD